MLEKFTKDSGVVKIWVSLVLTGVYEFEDVPEIKNLKDVVAEVINEMTGGVAMVGPKVEETPVAEKPAAEDPVEASVMDESTESQPVNDDPSIDLMAAPETSETEEAIPAEMA